MKEQAMPRITTQFADRARAQQERFSAARQAIEDDPDLSPEGRQRKITELRTAHREQQRAVQAEERTHLVGRRSELVSRLYGINRSDPAAVIGHRDATDRAAKLTTDGDAQALIERATLNGDEQLASAVAQRAADMEWGNAFDAWRSARPHVHDIVDELGDIDTLLEPKNNFTRGVMEFGGGVG